MADSQGIGEGKTYDKSSRKVFGAVSETVRLAECQTVGLSVRTVRLAESEQLCQVL